MRLTEDDSRIAKRPVLLAVDDEVDGVELLERTFRGYYVVHTATSASS